MHHKQFFAKAGATYVSPFVGRLDDQSVAGLEVVRSISELYRIHGIRTQVLSASIRSVQRCDSFLVQWCRDLYDAT